MKTSENQQFLLLDTHTYVGKKNTYVGKKYQIFWCVQGGIKRKYWEEKD